MTRTFGHGFPWWAVVYAAGAVLIHYAPRLGAAVESWLSDAIDGVEWNVEER